jgi:hypothetical protein
MMCRLFIAQLPEWLGSFRRTASVSLPDSGSIAKRAKGSKLLKALTAPVKPLHSKCEIQLVEPVETSERVIARKDY